MDIALAIVVSVALLSVVLLFVATKDRWNWKRITAIVIGAPAVVALLATCGVVAYDRYQNLPRAQLSFEEVPLLASRADVRFLKGEPNADMSGVEEWVWALPVQRGMLNQGPVRKASLSVTFWKDSVGRVAFIADTGRTESPWLLGFHLGSSYEDVFEKLGQPSFVSTSKDGLLRILTFATFNVFFAFERGRVTAYGITAGRNGPVRFIDEVDPPDTVKDSRRPPLDSVP
jgi:hypothetical protein